jgi:hypothetical protein
MIERGKLVCDECGEMATYWFVAPKKSAASDGFWCDKHVPVLQASWKQYRISQDLCSIDKNNDQVWLTSLFVNGKWERWPLKSNQKKWWQFWK